MNKFRIGEVVDFEMGDDARTAIVKEILPNDEYWVLVRTTGAPYKVASKDLHKLYIIEKTSKYPPYEKWKEYSRSPQQ